MLVSAHCECARSEHKAARRAALWVFFFHLQACVMVYEVFYALTQ
jgi:hypothetical protein